MTAKLGHRRCSVCRSNRVKRDEPSPEPPPIPPQIQTPAKRRLPPERSGVTHKFSINGNDGYLTVSVFEDGRVGEIFLRMAKQGSTIAGFCDLFSILFSVALQHGVPLEELIDKCRGVRFEPSGLTQASDIRSATSIADYVARWLEVKFLAKEIER